jgi:hypothetical protein
LAKAMQKTVLKLREDWDSDDPSHWAQFILCKLTPADSTALHIKNLILRHPDGSWFCRNVSK